MPEAFPKNHMKPDHSGTPIKPRLILTQPVVQPLVDTAWGLGFNPDKTSTSSGSCDALVLELGGIKV